MLHTCDGFTLARCWVPTKFALSLLLDRGEKIKGSWIGIRAGRSHLLQSQAKQIGLEEMSWIYYQSNQNRAMKNPKNTFPLPSFIHRLNFPPIFLCLFPQQFIAGGGQWGLQSVHRITQGNTEYITRNCRKVRLFVTPQCHSHPKRASLRHGLASNPPFYCHSSFECFYDLVLKVDFYMVLF